MRPIAITLMLAVGVGALACGEKKAGETPKSAATGPFMTKFRIGREVASDRTVAVETGFFGQGEPINISFEVKNVPPKSLAKVVWSDSSQRKISEEQKQIASGTGAVSFELKGAGLAMGNYSVQFFYGDPGEAPEKWWSLGAHTFRIGSKPPS